MKALKTELLPTKELVAISTGEKLSVAASVTEAFGLSRLLVNREIIAPGRKTAPAHSHSLKEEVFIVESGFPSILLNGAVQKLSPGDTIGLKPENGMRMVFNDSAEEAIVWTIGSNDEADVVEFLEKKG